MAAESHRLFVGGLPPDITDQELCARFFRSLNVQGVERKDKPTVSGEPKVFAFVSVGGALEDVQECVNTFNQTKWKGRIITLQIARKSYLDRLKEEQEMVKTQSPVKKEGEPTAKKTVSTSPVKKPPPPKKEPPPPKKEPPQPPKQKPPPQPPKQKPPPQPPKQEPPSCVDDNTVEDDHQYRKRSRSQDEDDSDSDWERKNLKKFKGLLYHYGSTSTKDLPAVESDLQQLTTDCPEDSSRQKCSQDSWEEAMQNGDNEEEDLTDHSQDNDDDDGPEHYSQDDDDEASADYSKYNNDNHAAGHDDNDEEQVDYTRYNNYDDDDELGDSRFVDNFSEVPDVTPSDRTNHKPAGTFRLLNRYEPPSKVAEDEVSSSTNLAEATEAASPDKSKKSKKLKKTSDDSKSAKKSVSFAPESKKSGAFVNIQRKFQASKSEGSFKFLLSDDQPGTSCQLPTNLSTHLDLPKLKNTNIKTDHSLPRTNGRVKTFFKVDKDVKAEAQNFKNQTGPVVKPDLYQAFRTMRKRKKN